MISNNQQFDDRLKIVAFRAITDQLLERHLITEDEFRKISQRIERMENNLLAGKPLPQKPQHSATVGN